MATSCTTLALGVAALFAPGSLALDNGLAVTPPMGWRSWNCFLGDVSQPKILAVIDAFADRTRTVDGVPTSLLDLGYQHIGIDDGWQLCDSGSEQPSSFHDAAGKPIVNTSKFQDLKSMTAYAESKGFFLGWYENNCICHESKSHIHNDTWVELTYHGDVAQLVDNNFRGVKLDSCGLHSNVTFYSELINQSGKPMMIENCHQGSDNPTDQSVCPYNLYRTSGDIRSNYNSVMHNLRTTIPYIEAEPPLSFPGCWAYPDMLEVGRLASFFEDRSHFGGWAIVSAPLILGLDPLNATKMSSVWDIIANKEAIAVNQNWAGHPGRSINTTSPEAQVWAKLQPNNSQAVLIINDNQQKPLTMSVKLADLGLPDKVKVRDIWLKRDVGMATGSIDVQLLASHDSQFFLLSPA